jgi:hypothetical protein
MKFKLLALICISQLVLSCSKSGSGGGGSTPTPTGGSKGYIRVTFGGKTLEIRDTILYKGTSLEYFVPINGGGTSNYIGGGYFSKVLSIGDGPSLNPKHNGNLNIMLAFTIDSSLSNNLVDTYTWKGIVGSSFKIIDASSGITYPIDTPSRGTISYSDDFYTEGTLNLTLIGSGGSKIPATGVFKIYHK